MSDDGVELVKRTIPKQCGRCGQTFICGLSGCWCSRISVPDAQYAVILERFHDCLCPACLTQVSSGRLDLAADREDSAPTDR